MGKEPCWFYERLVEQLDEQQDEAASDEPLVQALEHVVSESKPFWGSPQELLAALQMARDEVGGIRSEGLPYNASALSREIKKVMPELRRRGWLIVKHSRKWQIECPPGATIEMIGNMSKNLRAENAAKAEARRAHGR
jgi:hypothetical protein